jgi:DNA invertase Pin-like site-specific DNA recombinase
MHLTASRLAQHKRRCRLKKPDDKRKPGGSGDAKLARPELFRLLADDGDILLVEQVDRLSRLTSGDWEKLKAEINARHNRVVALDLPISWMMAARADEFTGRMFEAINQMLLDMLAAVARKDYDDRRRRQAQGQAKAQGSTRAAEDSEAGRIALDHHLK